MNNLQREGGTPSTASTQWLPSDHAESQEGTKSAGVVDAEKGIKAANTTVPVNDWIGPQDPDNPLNWPAWKRHFQIAAPAMISFSATLASSIYSPAFPVIKEEFGVSSTVALLPLSLYVLALGAGPVLGAPISETYGRHVVYLISAPLGGLFTMGAGFSQNIWTLCILRFLAGMTFSPALAIGAGTIADVNIPEKRAIPSAIYIFSPFLGPALGPVIGSFVTVRKSWRWTQWTIVFFAIFSMTITLMAQETYKKTILLRRNKKLGLPPLPSPFPDTKTKLKFLVTVTFLRPLHMLITEPIVAFLSLYVAFNFSVLFGFFAAFPYVFRNIYHFDTEQSGLVFLALGVGCVLAVITCVLCDRYLYQPQVKLAQQNGGKGTVPPEYRLYAAMMGSFGLPLGLFWFAWTTKKSVSWASPVVAAVPFAWGNLAIFIAAATYLVDTYQSMTGASAMAANGLLRYTLSSAFPLFALQMYQRLGIAWATSLLGFITIALMPIPWLLFKFGHGIRNRSKYDTLKI